MSTLGVAHAQSGDNYNRISFSVEAKTQVDNDEMRATLTKTTEAKTAKEIAKTLNDTINNALAIAKNTPMSSPRQAATAPIRAMARITILAALQAMHPSKLKPELRAIKSAHRRSTDHDGAGSFVF